MRGAGGHRSLAFASRRCGGGAPQMAGRIPQPPVGAQSHIAPPRGLNVGTTDDCPVGLAHCTGTIVVHVGNIESKTQALIDIVGQAEVERVEIVLHLTAFRLPFFLLIGTDEMPVRMEPPIANRCLPPGSGMFVDVERSVDGCNLPDRAASSHSPLSGGLLGKKCRRGDGREGEQWCRDNSMEVWHAAAFNRPPPRCASMSGRIHSYI